MGHEPPRFSVILLAQGDRAEKADGGGGPPSEDIQAESPYSETFLLCLLSPYNLLPCQQQTTQGTCPQLLSRRALFWSNRVWSLTSSQSNCKFIWTQEFSQLLCFSCYWHFITFLWKREQELFSSCLFFLVIFTKNEAIAPLLTLCQTQTTASVIVLSLTLFSQYVITFSSESWPTRVPTVDSNNSRSVDSLNGFPVNIYCLKFAFQFMHFLI